MNTYKLIPTTPAIEKKRLIKETLIAIPLVISIGIIGHLMKNRAPEDSLLSSFLFAAVFIVTRTVFLYDNAKTESERNAGYKLTIDENSIACETATGDIVTIGFTKIKYAKEHTFNKRIVIKGGRLKDKIVIPANIENYDQIRHVLSQHLDLKKTNSIGELLLNVLLVIAIFISLIVFNLLTMQNVYITWPAAVAAGSTLIWGGFMIAIKPLNAGSKLFGYIFLLICSALIAILLFR